MPHFIVECSNNVLNLQSSDDILSAVYKAARSSELFAESGVGGVKVRLNPYDHYMTVGTKNDFIHVFAHIMEGRTAAQKNELSKKVVGELVALFPSISIVSMNIYDISKTGYCNKSVLMPEI